MFIRQHPASSLCLAGGLNYVFNHIWNGEDDDDDDDDGDDDDDDDDDPQWQYIYAVLQMVESTSGELSRYPTLCVGGMYRDGHDILFTSHPIYVRMTMGVSPWYSIWTTSSPPVSIVFHKWPEGIPWSQLWGSVDLAIIVSRDLHYIARTW